MRKGSLNPETVRIIRVDSLIKLSKFYDDDGYVSVFPLRGPAEQHAQRAVGSE